MERLPETCPFCKKSLIYYGLGGLGVINHEHQGETGNVIVTCDYCRKRFALSEEAMDAEAPDWKNWPPEEPLEYTRYATPPPSVVKKIDPSDVNNSNTIVGGPFLWPITYSKGFTITEELDEPDTPFWQLFKRAQERLARAFQHNLEHDINETECTPSCPDYVVPAPPPPPRPCCGECGRELDDDYEMEDY